MCGRFANAQSIPQYRAAVREELPDRRAPTPASDADDYTPSHNVAPQTRSPVVRRELTWERELRLKTIRNPTEQDRELQLIIQTMKWGLVPRFHKKPPSYGEAYKTINARDDTILSPQKSMWHSLLPSQRCVVFVQGFYEWQKRGGSGDADNVERIPHFVGMTEPGHGRNDKLGHGKRLMPLAGLWESVRFEGQDKPLYTFTIVTTASNKQLGFLHDRMPVILPTAQAISTWLGMGVETKSEDEVKTGKDVDDSWSLDVAKLLRPLQGELECYKVPKEVGKVGNNNPSFILPIEERKDGLKAFLARQKQPKQATSGIPTTLRETNESSADVVKKEPSQNVDIIMSTCSKDSHALRTAQEAEEQAALAEVGARAEQEEEDRKLAEQMQQEFEQQAATGAQEDSGAKEISRSESIVVLRTTSNSESTQNSARRMKSQESDSIQGDDVGDGFGVRRGEEAIKDSTWKRHRSASASDGPSKRSRACSSSSSSSSSSPHTHNLDANTNALEPSSRFSPDPYNPPLSPPRPRGGYSRELSPSSGGGIHINPPRGKTRAKPRHEAFPQAPPHTWRSRPKKERGPIDEMLDRQRRNAEHERHDQRTMRSEPSPARASQGTLDGRSPKAKRAQAMRAARSDKGKRAGSDIRSFFSPQNKS